MCQMCIDICEQLELIYGHAVDPEALAQLIEDSPLAPVKHNPKPKYTRLSEVK